MNTDAPLTPRQLFHFPAGPHPNTAPPRQISFTNLFGWRNNLPSPGKIRAGYLRKNSVIRRLRICCQLRANGRQLAQIMGRNFCSHADSNAGGTIHQQKWQARRESHRFFQGTIIITAEIDGALINLTQQQLGDGGQIGFGIAHGCSRITIQRTKITLSIHHGITQGKMLRHAHHGIIYRTVPMGMPLADHLTHHPGRFDVFGRTLQAHIAHGI